MIPDQETKLRLPILTEEKITPQSDSNTRRHLSVITEYLKFLFDQDHIELRKHESSGIPNFSLIFYQQNLVMRAIKSKAVRAHFCSQMKNWPNNEPMSMLQFKYCARLTDAILTDSTGSSDQARLSVLY